MLAEPLKCGGGQARACGGDEACRHAGNDCAGERADANSDGTNYEHGSTRAATIALPIDTARARAGATFSRASAWASRSETDHPLICTAHLDREGDVVTSTPRLEVLADAPSGGNAGGRRDFTWRDARRGGSGDSNLLELPVGRPPQPAAQ